MRVTKKTIKALNVVGISTDRKNGKTETAIPTLRKTAKKTRTS